MQVGTSVVNADGGGSCHRGIVAAAINVGYAAAPQFQIGLGNVGDRQIMIRIECRIVTQFFAHVVIVTVTATKEGADNHHSFVGSICSFSDCC